MTHPSPGVPAEWHVAVVVEQRIQARSSAEAMDALTGPIRAALGGGEVGIAQARAIVVVSDPETMPVAVLMPPQAWRLLLEHIERVEPRGVERIMGTGTRSVLGEIRDQLEGLPQ